MNSKSIIKYSILTSALGFQVAKAEEVVNNAVSDTAAQAVNNVEKPAPSVNNGAEVAYHSCFGYSYDALRDSSKDKPWSLSMDFVSVSTWDFQDTNPTHSLSAAKLQNIGDKPNDKAIDSFMAAELSVSKEFYLALQNKLGLSISRGFGDNTLEFSRYYWEGDLENGMKIKLGKDNGNFGTHIASSDRYSTHQVSFTHKLDNGIKYTVALEQALVDTKNDTAKDKKYKEIQFGKDKVSTTAESTELYWYTSNTMPKIALVANVSYTEDKLFEVGLNTLGTVAKYYKSKQNLESYSNESLEPIYAVCGYGKYVILSSEEFFKSEQLITKAHVKFRNGALDYNAEAGGLGSLDDKNMLLGTSELEAIQTLAFGLEVKHFWLPNIFSSIKGDYIMSLTDLDNIKEDKRIENALKTKVVPVGFQIGENFGAGIGYNFVSKNDFDEMGHRAFVEVGLSI